VGDWKLQTYECRLRKARVLRVSDSLVGQYSVSNDADAARWGYELCRGLPHEQLWVLLLNGRNELTGAVRVSEGGLHGCALRPADVLRPVLVAAASGFVMVHNHPSGDATPSQADRDMTRVVHDAAELVGVHLLDHVVVTQHRPRWHAMGARGED
jgi:DNA repair protein RadC